MDGDLAELDVPGLDVKGLASLQQDLSISDAHGYGLKTVKYCSSGEKKKKIKKNPDAVIWNVYNMF